MLKNLPIGRDNFKDVIERDLYYVDKTNIIEEILRTDSYVSLFPRPRRFGKSLFISMIDNFFNIEYKDTNMHLFDGLKISNSKYYNRLSSNPVIKLDFKNLKQGSKNTSKYAFVSSSIFFLNRICCIHDFIYPLY